MSTVEVLQQKISNNMNLQHKLPVEVVITSHHIFLLGHETDDRILNILHKDLFDDRKEVVLSALDTLKKIGSKESISFIVRLLKHKDVEVRSKAVESLGKMGTQELLPALIDMFKTSKDEHLRFKVLEALLKINQDDSEVKTLLRAYAASPVISGQAKANAIELLLKYDNDANVDYFLKDPSIKTDVIERLAEICENYPNIKSSLINYGNNKWRSLTVIQKSLLVKVADPFTSKEERDILMNGLLDVHPDVRKTCYQCIGDNKYQKTGMDDIVKFLIDGSEINFDAEDEAIRCIRRIENLKNESSVNINGRYINEVIKKINEQFLQLTKETRRVMSDSHELGWFIVHGREYLEFYGNEEFKQELINYLKKSSNYSMEELLCKLKNTAIRIEVGHFNGYNALRDLIKEPKKNGVALITRELALAKTGKRRLVSCLIRLLYITRLFNWKDESRIAEQIYKWAYNKKLFRLAEAALYSMENTNKDTAGQIIRENITIPITSKILALASLKLLRKDEWLSYKNEIVQLLNTSKDTYIILSVINILDNNASSIDKELQIAFLQRLINDNNKEIISRISYLLGKKAESVIIDSIMDFFKRVNDSKKVVLLEILESIIVKYSITNDIGLNEFLYKILREEKSGSIKIQALIILYRMKDNYSYKAIESFLKNSDIKDKSILISRLESLDNIDISFISNLLLRYDNRELHTAFRSNLKTISDEYRERLNENFIVIRSGANGHDKDDKYANNPMINDIKIDFSEEKKAYEFENEHIGNLTVVFTDIEGYTHKSLTLSEMELASLIKDYESILIPIFNQHSGRLIKRIGDGHLFVFEHPLNAVLGALRFEKALKRFNDFREERLKITVRIGIHHGQVILENGDVLGNTVNLASRLEESAKGGRIYISHNVYDSIKDYIHTNSIGEIKVKGIDEPVMVYEPYEIMVSLPKELDPANKEYSSNSISGNNSFNSIEVAKTPDIDTKIYTYIKHTFSVIHNMCVKAEKGEIEISLIKKELRRRWALLRKAIG